PPTLSRNGLFPELFMLTMNTEYNLLLEAIVPFAQKVLEEHGEFYPFGAFIDPDGKLNLRTGSPDTEYPNPSELIDQLRGELAEEARQGRLVASVICVNVSV